MAIDQQPPQQTQDLETVLTTHHQSSFAVSELTNPPKAASNSKDLAGKLSWNWVL